MSVARDRSYFRAFGISENDAQWTQQFSTTGTKGVHPGRQVHRGHRNQIIGNSALTFAHRWPSGSYVANAPAARNRCCSWPLSGLLHDGP